MKTSITLCALAALQHISATPFSKRQDFSTIQYPPGTGANLHEYPPGTGANLHEYPPGTGENPPNGPPATPNIPVTSTFHLLATPYHVVNGYNNPVFMVLRGVVMGIFVTT